MCTRHWIFVYQVQTLEGVKLIQYVEANLNLIFPWDTLSSVASLANESPYANIFLCSLTVKTIYLKK